MRGGAGDPVQANETQLWDFEGNMEKQECLLELVTVGLREALWLERTCWD